ncbi:hypothetical protein [Clostridium lundense]|uniref:hypothetical protein n=1 Tax=Clostridium lundense TaxID=319475 RepID=UPI000ADE6A15|nr:hypothetical protein [Clostridium lundense]
MFQLKIPSLEVSNEGIFLVNVTRKFKKINRKNVVIHGKLLNLLLKVGIMIRYCE